MFCILHVLQHAAVFHLIYLILLYLKLLRMSLLYFPSLYIILLYALGNFTCSLRYFTLRGFLFHFISHDFTLPLLFILRHLIYVFLNLCYTTSLHFTSTDVSLLTLLCLTLLYFALLRSTSHYVTSLHFSGLLYFN